MVRGTKHADVQGQPCIGNEFSGEHSASQAFAKDCTAVYGDCRGIASAITVLDACVVHGL